MGFLAILGYIFGGLLTLLILLYITAYIVTHYVQNSPNKENRDVHQKNIIITGGTSGIGKEAAKDLYLKGANIIFTGRSYKKAEAIVDEIKEEIEKQLKDSKNDVELLAARLDDLRAGSWDEEHNFSSTCLHYRKLDQSSLAQVTQFTDWAKANLQSLDTLHCNAGLVCVEEKKTEEGFDFAMGITHFAHFLMTHELLDLLKATPKSRVVTTSSEAHVFEMSGKKTYIDLTDIDWKKSRTKYDAAHRYSCSKLANVLFTVALADLFDRKGWEVKAVCLHPGGVRSGFFDNFKGGMKYLVAFLYPIFLTAWEGAQTSLYCILSDWGALENGKYYANCKPKRVNKVVEDGPYWKKFWNLSREEIKYKGGIETELFEDYNLDLAVVEGAQTIQAED